MDLNLKLESARWALLLGWEHVLEGEHQHPICNCALSQDSGGRTRLNHGQCFQRGAGPPSDPPGPLQNPYRLIPALSLTWNTKTPAAATQWAPPQGCILCPLRFHELTLTGANRV